jgi:sec-independent protein translocase protein TatB
MAGTGLTGFLQNLTGTEMIVILVVALVVLGPERLPEMARGAGRMLHKLRTMTDGLQNEVRDVMADPAMQPLKELGELAARPRQKLTEYALEAEAEERAKREAAAADAAVEPEQAADQEPTTEAVGADPAGDEPAIEELAPGTDEPVDDAPAGQERSGS